MSSLSSLSNSIFLKMIEQHQAKQQQQRQDQQIQKEDNYKLLDALRTHQNDLETTRDKEWARHMDLAGVEGEQAAQMQKQMPQNYESPAVNESAQVGYNKGLIGEKDKAANHAFELLKAKESTAWRPDQLKFQYEKLNRDDENKDLDRAMKEKLGNLARMHPEVWARIAESQRYHNIMAGDKDQAQTRQLEKDLTSADIPTQAEVFGAINRVLEKYPAGDVPGMGLGRSIMDNVVPGGTTLANMYGGDDATTMSQALAQLSNVVLKNRSGAAVTNQEFDRFKKEALSGVATTAGRRNAIKRMYDIFLENARNVGAGFDDGTVQNYQNQGGNIGAVLPQRKLTPPEILGQKQAAPASAQDPKLEAGLKAYMDASGKDRATALQDLATKYPGKIPAGYR